MAQTKPTEYVTTPDGRRITYARWKYEETARQEAILAQVNDLITSDASAAVSAGANFGQQEFGGLLRKVVPNLLDQYGNVNATAAMQFYNRSRDQWYAQRTGLEYSDLARAEKRYATAVTKSAIRLNRTGFAEYVAQYADDYRVAEKSDSVINYVMKVRAQSGHEPSVQAMNKALTREVASYHHDTILFNSALDPAVNRVQRVAQASACPFCRLMALGSTRGTVRVSTYASKFHDHCHCTIQALFEGEEPVRPPYYDDFEKQYAEVSSEQSQFGSPDAKSVLRTWRAKDTGKGVFVRGSEGWGYKKTELLAKSDSPAAAARAAIMEAKDTATVGEILKSHLPDTNIGGFDAPNLHLDSVKSIGSNVVDLLDRYGEGKSFGSIEIISASRSNKNATAWVSTSTKLATDPGYHRPWLGLNARELQAQNAEAFALSQESSHASGWFSTGPGNDPWKSVVTHEFGHFLDATKSDAGMNEFSPVAELWKEFRTKKGFAVVTDESRTLYKDQISQYGRSNAKEAVAEAFADYELNGANAKEFSKVIINDLLKRRSNYVAGN